MNITTFGLLTAGVVLCYSRVRVYIKGHLNLSLDISCCLWLGCSLRVLHWYTHSCQREYSHVAAPDVGTGFALAISMPTCVASRVGTSLALAISVPMLLASCVGTSIALARSMPTLGCPLCLTRGEGVDSC